MHNLSPATAHHERTFPRRDLLAAALAIPCAGLVAYPRAYAAPARHSGRFFFTSQGKTGLASIADPSGEVEIRYLELQAPDQVAWQPGPMFADGRRVVMLSMEPRRDGPGKPFDEYYTQTPTHIWSYDLDSGELVELCTRERIAPFQTPALLLHNDRLLVQVVKDRVGQMINMRLDGSDPRPFTASGEGLPYGFSLSPDGRRVAFHLASPQGYQVWTSDTQGGKRAQLAGGAGHLYFGTSWSPDGQWVLYVDCLHERDPGHDWADVCISRGDGSQAQVLTQGQSMWFAATYGNEQTRGGGSNLPAWTRDGRILFPRRTPGTRVPWPYRVGQPDVDHFNRDYKPDEARGGTEICRLDPRDRSAIALTSSDPPVWDFRASLSPDGRWLVFCRAAVGEAPAIWIADAEGRHARQVTRGIDERGADHPRWLPG